MSRMWRLERLPRTGGVVHGGHDPSFDGGQLRLLAPEYPGRCG